MATYRLKPTTFEIEPFVEGMEDGWYLAYSGNLFHYEKNFPKNEGKQRALDFIQNNEGLNEVDCEDRDHEIIYEDPLPFIMVNWEKNYISTGDYIRTDSEGKLSVISEKQLKEEYELISQ